MTQEEKNKTYDKAIEKARNIIKYYKEHNRGDECSVEDLEEVFPELKEPESEDEKIRKHIYNYINVTLDDNESVEKEKWLDWLEKQGEPKILGVGVKYASGVLKECIDKIAPKSAMETIKEEKVDNQNCVNPADMNAQKFRVGDWVTNGCITCQITFIDSRYWCSETCVLGNVIDIDKTFHLWAIQDAKDGDILVDSKHDVILMFRGIGNTKWDDVIDYHCYYNYYYEEFIVQEDVDYWGNIKNNQLKPATKEQRNTLIKAMADAGWEFDFEKKELLEIEEELTDFENSLKHIMIETIECGDTRNLKADAEMLLRIAQKPKEWSEEDEKKLKRLIHICEDNLEMFDYTGINDDIDESLIHWVKSLKERIGG